MQRICGLNSSPMACASRLHAGCLCRACCNWVPHLVAIDERNAHPARKVAVGPIGDGSDYEGDGRHQRRQPVGMEPEHD